MEHPLYKKMKENQEWFVLMSVLFGVIFCFCIFGNESGVARIFLDVTLLVVSFQFLNKVGIVWKKSGGIYCVGILLLGLSTIKTTNSFFHIFNTIGIVLLFILLIIHQIYEDKNWDYPQYMTKIIYASILWIGYVIEPFKGKKRPQKKFKESLKDKKTKQILVGVAAAVGVLLVVLPLLLMSDRIFSQLFGFLFGWIDLSAILENLKLEKIIGIGLTFLTGMVGIYAFFAGIFDSIDPVCGKNVDNKWEPVTGIAFLSVLGFVYSIFSLIQVLFLFLRIGNGLPGEMTYSQYAREGFWQLLFVGIINFATVIICKALFEENRILKGLLLLVSSCTCIMILSASYRMALYILEYHLTFLRVFVLWFLMVLILVFFGLMYHIINPKFRLFPYAVSVVSVLYIGFSLCNVDRIIAAYNIRHTEELNQHDIEYLIYDLSRDAAPEITEIAPEQLWKTEMLTEVDIYFSDLEKEDRQRSLREWNYADYQAKQAAKKWRAMKKQETNIRPDE